MLEDTTDEIERFSMDKVGILIALKTSACPSLKIDIVHVHLPRSPLSPYALHERGPRSA